MRYRKYIFGLLLFVCCPALGSSRAAPGWHGYANVGMFTAYREPLKISFQRQKTSFSVPSLTPLHQGYAGQAVGTLKNQFLEVAYSYTWPLRSGHGTQALATREVNIQSDAESDQLEYGSEEWHQEKKKLDAMLWASIVIVTILFTGIILVTIIRMGRGYRKRVTGDTKPEPTEYVDAWSQYRLPEEDNDE